jgi:hypothetical protein
MFSLTTLASACGLLLPKVQVCPVVTSYTAAVTVPERSSTYELAPGLNGSWRAAADADGVALARVAVALGFGLVAVALGTGRAEVAATVGRATGPAADGLEHACTAVSRGSPIAPARQARAIAGVQAGLRVTRSALLVRTAEFPCGRTLRSPRHTLLARANRKAAD